jgi:hypothetical protein
MPESQLSVKEQARLTQNMEQLQEHQKRDAVFVTPEMQQDKRLYRTETVLSDIQKIDEILANKEALAISEKDAERLRLMSGKSHSFLLLNDRQTSKDSPEMQEVKRTLAALERLKEQPLPGGFTEEGAQLVSDQYDRVIAACDAYIRKKDGRPFWPAHARRYDMVMQNRDRLRKEKAEYEQNWKYGANKELVRLARSAQDLLTLSKFRQEPPAPDAVEKDPVVTKTKADLSVYCNERITSLRAKAIFRIDLPNICRLALADITMMEQEINKKLKGKIKDKNIPALRKEIDGLFNVLEKRYASDYNAASQVTGKELEELEKVEKDSYEHGVLEIMEQEGVDFVEAEKQFADERLKAKQPFTMLHIDEAAEKNKPKYEKFERNYIKDLNANLKRAFPDDNLTGFTFEELDKMLKDYTDAIFANNEKSYQIRVGDPNTIALILNSGRFRSQVEGNCEVGGGGLANFLRRDFTAQKYGVNLSKADKGERLHELYTILNNQNAKISAEERKKLEDEVKRLEYLPENKYEIYGYLSHGDLEKETDRENSKINVVKAYGQVIVKLKPERMKERITMIIGDSLNDRFDSEPVKEGQSLGLRNACGRRGLILEAYKFFKKKQDPKYDPKKDKDLNIDKLLDVSAAPYVELQFHGGVSADDIESVTIDGDAEADDFMESKYITHERLPDYVVEMLREKGIKAYNIKNHHLTEATTTQEDLLAEYQNLKQELKSSRKGGFLGIFRSNSAEFDAVLTCLGDTYKALSKTGFKTKQDITSGGVAILSAMQAVKDACDTYLKKSGHNSSAGAARASLILKTQLKIINDIASLKAGLDAFQQGEETFQQGFSWAMMLRTRMINIRRPLKEMNHVGNAMSDLVEIKKTDDPVGGGFFREEEILKIKTPEEVLASCKEKTLNQLKADGYKITDVIKNTLDGITNTRRLYTNSNDPMAKLTVNYLTKIFLPEMRTMGNIQNMGMKEKTQGASGKGISLGDRDVAAFRVASLFGQEHLVAKTEKVEIKNWGAKYKGHLMQKAPGTEAAVYGANLIAEKEKNGDHSGMGENDIRKKVTSSFLRDMNNMMIIDYICGQKDRHCGNYFVKEDSTGKLVSATGIDNNLAFGSNREFDFSATYLPVPVSANGDLLLKCMDKEMADTILAMRPEMFRLELAGLLVGEEIDAALERLEKLQTAIAREIDKGNDDMFIDARGNWVERFDDLKSLKGQNGEPEGDSTYLGSFMDGGGGMSADMLSKERAMKKGKDWFIDNKNMTFEQLARAIDKTMGGKPLDVPFETLIFLEQKKGEAPFSPAERIVTQKGLSDVQKKLCEDLILKIGRQKMKG